MERPKVERANLHVRRKVDAEGASTPHVNPSGTEVQLRTLTGTRNPDCPVG